MSGADPKEVFLRLVALRRKATAEFVEAQLADPDQDPVQVRRFHVLTEALMACLEGAVENGDDPEIVTDGAAALAMSVLGQFLLFQNGGRPLQIEECLSVSSRAIRQFWAGAGFNTTVVPTVPAPTGASLH